MTPITIRKTTCTNCGQVDRLQAHDPTPDQRAAILATVDARLHRRGWRDGVCPKCNAPKGEEP